MPDRVGVTIVTWNAADLVGAALASVPDDVDVVVVDNASGDATLERVHADRPDATVITLPSNTGFAAAANAGLRELAEKDAVLLLNPDCRLAPGALDALNAFLSDHPRAGLVSALVCAPDGVPERYASGRDAAPISVAVHELGLSRLLPRWSLYRAGSPIADEQREWVAGTALLARRAALDEVGLLDERYFLYAEDLDWCHRMRSHGWEVWTCARARAEHLHGASVAGADAAIRRHRITSLDSYVAAHSSHAATTAVRVLRLIGYAVRALLFGAAALVTRNRDLRSKGRTNFVDARIAASLIRLGP